MEVHIIAREVLFDHGVVALGVLSPHDQMATAHHPPAVLFEPHALAALEAIQFPACLLFRFVFSCTLQFALGLLERLDRTRGLVFLFPGRFEIALGVLMDAGVQLQHHLRTAGFVVVVGENHGDGSFGGNGADDPWNLLDGLLDLVPSVPFNRFVGLVEQPLNVGPVLLNQMTKALLLLDFF